MNVKLKFRRANGKATMFLDATELHNYLREQGVQMDAGTPTKFADRPRTNWREIDTDYHKVGTELLLTTGPQEVDLGRVYGGPVGLDTLNTLADSAGEVVRAIVDHYRPIEISVVIAGKAA